MTRWQWYKPACQRNRICPHGEQSVILDPQDDGPARAIHRVLLHEQQRDFRASASASACGDARSASPAGIFAEFEGVVTRAIQFLIK
jgi:hypothetical protein